MIPAPELVARLTSFGQAHVFAGWETLTDAEQTRFVEELNLWDYAELSAYHANRNQPQAKLPPRSQLAPMPTEQHADVTASTIKVGEDGLRQGQVAVLLVAGGQGTRLGALQPKGFFPVGPVSGASLFRIHAEKVLALSRRYGARVPFLVMTSPITHTQTMEYFQQHSYFGLPQGDVHFFVQGSMPALDLETGQLLLERPGKLALSPDGHGGTLTALAATGLLARLKAIGIRTIFYFQVDNPLVRMADPAFLGRHLETNAEVSSKIIRKVDPAERVGLLILVEGRCTIVEYSDLPPDLANERDPDGTLTFRAGSPAIHLFDLAFLERITNNNVGMPFHLARKKVPHWNPLTGTTVTPTSENALKFERFVFDALPLAQRSLAMEVTREEEFAPLKNATGPDSPDTVAMAISNLARKWLVSAGCNVGPGPVEISPLFALDGNAVKTKFQPGVGITPPVYLQEN